jgi:hypothetical protein
MQSAYVPQQFATGPGVSDCIDHGTSHELKYCDGLEVSYKACKEPQLDYKPCNKHKPCEIPENSKPLINLARNPDISQSDMMDPAALLGGFICVIPHRLLL